LSEVRNIRELGVASESICCGGNIPAAEQVYKWVLVNLMLGVTILLASLFILWKMIII